MPCSNSDPALHEAIGLVYDSVLDPAAWPKALGAMCALVDGCTADIAVHDTIRRETRFAVEWHGEMPSDWPAWRKLFDDKYDVMMLFYSALPQFEIGDVHNTASMAEMIGSKNIYDDPFFREWALPAGLRDSIASIIMKTPDRMATFLIHTSTNRDLVGPREFEIGRLLVSHVRRAVVIGDLLQGSAGMTQTLQSTLDSLAAAIIVTDAQAQIVHSNRAGEAMLRAGTPVGVEQGLLRTKNPQATLALRKAIEQTANPGAIGGDGIGVPLRHDDGSPAIAHVLPLSFSTPNRVWVPRATAAVFIAPSQYALPDADALIALYGLTVMEAKVVMQIAAVRKRAEAAATLGIADSTAKTHLDRVFSKTATNNQAELSKLVTTLASPAGRPKSVAD